MTIEKRQVGSLEIACWMSGKAWIPDRKTLVFIHGSGGDHTVWGYQYGRLKGDFNIAALELPGHGSSDGPGEQDVAKYVEWVRAALPVFGIENPVLIGHSLGAAIALTFAVYHGELLSGVVACGGGLRMPVNPAILEGVRKDPAAIRAMTAKIAVAKKHRERLSPVLMEQKGDPEILYGDFLACDGLDITEAAKQIRVPALVVCGAEDKMMPLAHSEALRDAIPGAQMAVIAEAGHMVMMEEPEAFNEVLKQFVDRLPKEA
jgi:pimeloyl-ACP methyl ester carboxylesterase